MNTLSMIRLGHMSRTQYEGLVRSTSTLNSRYILTTYFLLLLSFLYLNINEGVLEGTMSMKNASSSKQVAKKGNKKKQSSST